MASKFSKRRVNRERTRDAAYERAYLAWYAGHHVRWMWCALGWDATFRNLVVCRTSGARVPRSFRRYIPTATHTPEL